MEELIDTIVYAGRLKDKSALMSSSSGGAFTALSDAFLKSGDAVVAAVYNYENHTVEFQMILDAVDVRLVMPSVRKRLFLWSRTKKALNIHKLMKVNACGATNVLKYVR